MPNDKRQEPDDDDDFASHAADEPTAVWDANTLRAAGLAELTKVQEEAAPKPAVTPGVGSHGPSIVVDDAAVPGAPAPRVIVAEPLGAPKRDLSWVLSIALASALGVGVYLLIRFLR